ncbi:MAG: LLM class F420-dependent oxidoreductase [Deltaproteobacteria bacterium]|nr:MAG: LLM class F420-dependent oxidoreductase [Deltaproteobacteria bacterium]
MKLGITMFATDQSMGPVDLAREAEARGFYSFYIPEHTHIPTSRETPPPTGEDELPEEYRRTLDPFVALAAAAAATEDLVLGTGICLVAQRDPIVTAKEVATLDRISDGRFVFGIGFGWNCEEMADHGVDYRTRRDLVREKTLLMKRLWEDEEASFAGQYVRLSPSWAWPKPRRQPPILIGGAAGPKLFAHIAEYADGWIPIGGAGVRAALPELARAAERAGRDPSELRVVPFGTIPDPGKLDYYASIGIDEVVLRIPSAGRDTVLRILDDYAGLLG